MNSIKLGKLSENQFLKLTGPVYTKKNKTTEKIKCASIFAWKSIAVFFRRVGYLAFHQSWYNNKKLITILSSQFTTKSTENKLSNEEFLLIEKLFLKVNNPSKNYPSAKKLEDEILTRKSGGVTPKINSPAAIQNSGQVNPTPQKRKPVTIPKNTNPNPTVRQNPTAPILTGNTATPEKEKLESQIKKISLEYAYFPSAAGIEYPSKEYPQEQLKDRTDAWMKTIWTNPKSRAVCKTLLKYYIEDEIQDLNERERKKASLSSSIDALDFTSPAEKFQEISLLLGLEIEPQKKTDLTAPQITKSPIPFQQEVQLLSGKKPVFNSELEIFPKNMRRQDAQRLLKQYLLKLKSEGRLFKQGEFNLQDYMEKSNDISRIGGRDFVERIIKENNLQHIKAPEKVVFVYQDEKVGENLKFTLDWMSNSIFAQDCVVYAKRVKPVARTISLEEAIEWALAVELSGIYDFDNGRNFIIAEDGIYFIDTEMKNFIPNKPIFEFAENYIVSLLAEKDRAPFLKEVQKRKALFNSPEKIQERELLSREASTADTYHDECAAPFSYSMNELFPS